MCRRKGGIKIVWISFLPYVAKSFGLHLSTPTVDFTRVWIYFQICRKP